MSRTSQEREMEVECEIFSVDLNTKLKNRFCEGIDGTDMIDKVRCGTRD